MSQKIAFIDDENNVLESLKWLFDDEPYQLFTFSSPTEALDALIKNEFAVVVSDQVMPEIEGTRLLRYVKNRWPRTECIIMTAHSLNRFEDVGDFRIITKPWDINEFKIAIRDAVASYEKRQSKVADIQTNKRNILYIENDLYSAKAIVGMLDVLGYEATLTTKSTEALRLIHTQPNLFDIVITDKNLGGLNGIELSIELKKIKPDIHIILCTGEILIDTEKVKETSGINEVLLKPFRLNELKNMIDKAFEDPLNSTPQK